VPDYKQEKNQAADGHDGLFTNRRGVEVRWAVFR
jgi:hypothetical protein